MTACPRFCVVDRLEISEEHLPTQLREDLDSCPSPVLLWVARRPRKNWFAGLSNRIPLVLSSAPRYEQIVWLQADCLPEGPSAFQEQCQYLLGTYRDLFELKTSVSECSAFHDYCNILKGHIARQEQDLFPRVLETLPISRCLRELSYEHRGLERGLQRLPTILQAARDGSLSKREKELFDLDFFHLLEHHLERESGALYPALPHLGVELDTKI